MARNGSETSLSSQHEVTTSQYIRRVFGLNVVTKIGKKNKKQYTNVGSLSVVKSQRSTGNDPRVPCTFKAIWIGLKTNLRHVTPADPPSSMYMHSLAYSSLVSV